MQKLGIDLSRWQGNFDLNKAKNEGVEYAILKIGGSDGGQYKDSKFDTYYKDCESAGIPKGCYYFGEAMTLDEAKAEVQHWLSLMKGKKFEYPVWYDVEANMLKVDKSTLTQICKYVLSEIQKAGYWVGMYCSTYYYNTAVNDKELAAYSHWVADWGGSKPTLASGNAVQMWQFGGEKNLVRSNKIAGVVVDQNYCYIDYESKIKAKGLNGYTVNIGSSTGSNATSSSTGNENLKVGDKVKVINPIIYGTNKRFKAYYDTYELISLNGDRAVIGINGVKTAAINIANIKKA